MHTTAITVLDRTGTHTALWTPPPSRQPAPARKPSRFDRAAIMGKAWAAYRLAMKRGWTDPGFDAHRFAYYLGMEWLRAKFEVATAEKLARTVIPAPCATVYSDPVRAAAIQNELIGIEHSDCPSQAQADRERALKFELHRVTI